MAEEQESLVNNFNKFTQALYEEVRDFIMMHYYSSNRKEPFWVAARSEIELSETLRERLELWRYTFPSVIDTSGDRLFDYWNYLVVLYSKGFFKDVSMPLEGSTSKADWDRYLRRIMGMRRNMLETLPDHYELVTAIREAAEQGAKLQAPPVAAAAAGAFRSTVPVPDWGIEATRTEATAGAA
jgi:tryptophan halogenase